MTIFANSYCDFPDPLQKGNTRPAQVKAPLG